MCPHFALLPALPSTHTPGAPSAPLQQLQDLEEGDSCELLPATKSRYVVAELPLRLPVLRPAMDKPNPKLGVGECAAAGATSRPICTPTGQPAAPPLPCPQHCPRPTFAHIPLPALGRGAGSVAWSCDGSFLDTRCDSMPNAVWIWETSRLELASLLLQARPVRAVQWCPVDNRLVVCTGDSKLYLWTPEGASCVHIPLPGFRASGLAWHPDGTSLLLSSRSHFCCAYC